MHGLKWALDLMPPSLHRELKRLRYHYLIRRRRFVSPEKEFTLLAQMIHPGDLVLDIGANVGHYTLHFSALVGNEGRVLAFEPLSATFEFLAANVGAYKATNVTLFNVAVTVNCTQLNFSVPGGNPYQAHVSNDGDITVRGMPIDAVTSPEDQIKFIKVDAEGHDKEVLRSAEGCINKCRPIVMAELNEQEARNVANSLQSYDVLRFSGSHNSFLVPAERYEEVSRIIRQHDTATPSLNRPSTPT